MTRTVPGDEAPALRSPAVPAELRRARVATGVVFAVHGAVTGTFAARIPWIAGHVGVGVGGLGVALLMPGFGAMLAMPLSGRLVHRHDLRSLVRVLILIWCAALVLPVFPTSLVLLCLVLVLYGAAAGLADVAMNAHAVLVEQRYGRSVMSSMHGGWSGGVLAGSGAAAVAIRLTSDAQAEFLVTAVALMVVSLIASTRLLHHRAEPDLDAPPAFALPSRAVLLIGLVGLCAVFAEGAGLDWSAVYVRTVLGHPASTAALTVATFSVSMAVARFAGDWAVRRAGPVTVVRLAGLCATAGALSVVLGHSLVPVVCGFALIGIGIAVVVPLVFAAAGRIGPHPARSIAGVAGIAYGSGLVAPGIIGGIARLSSLTVSFVVVVLLMVVMTTGARVLRPAASIGQSALSPAESWRHVSENAVDDVRVVVNPELIGDGQQQRVGGGDPLVPLELRDELVRLGSVRSAEDRLCRRVDIADLVGLLVALTEVSLVPIVDEGKDAPAHRHPRLALVTRLLPCFAEGLDLLGLLQVKGLVGLVADQRRTLQVHALFGRPDRRLL
jgi:MFS family permease